MKLKALDQIHVSAVQSETLRPGQEFEISDAAGEELLKAHPGKFNRLDRPAKKAAPRPMNKKAKAPKNKGAVAPAV